MRSGIVYIVAAAIPAVPEPNAIYNVGGALFLIDPQGTPQAIGFASLSVQQTVLVAGTKALAVPGVTTTSKVLLTLAIPNTASSTIQYKAVCTANTVTITALIAAGTINAADISTLNVLVFP